MHVCYEVQEVGGRGGRKERKEIVMDKKRRRENREIKKGRGGVNLKEYCGIGRENFTLKALPSLHYK